MKRIMKIMFVILVMFNCVNITTSFGYTLSKNDKMTFEDKNNKEELKIITEKDRYENLMKQFKEDKKRIEDEKKRKEEERLRREEEDRKRTISIVVSFYTDLPEENGGCGEMTSSGKKLQSGMVASINELPIGTKLQSDKFGLLVVEDRMSRSVGLSRCTNGELPIDVFVARESGESIRHYVNRVTNMGILRTTVKLVA